MNTTHDLAVIGAGIHGAGVAQAAAAAGQRVLLLEQYPTLAQGTSSRSSKLVHGGLRYLETAQLGLVRESLRERAWLLTIAPELVKLLPFHIPVYRGSLRSRLKTRLGLSLYAGLGGLSRDARFTALPSAKWDRLDGLETGDLLAVFRYHDAQTDDAALTRAVVASARNLGAELLMSARVEAIALDESGVTLRYGRAGGQHEARVGAVVNAAGPWVNRVLALASPEQTALPIELVQGAHLVLPGRLERGIYYVEAPDGRVIFAMPWRSNILVGTTETPWLDDPAATYPTDAEIDYLLASFGRIFPGRRAGRGDIVAAFAGLRVLPATGGDAFRRPRDVVLFGSSPSAPRLLSVYGGKLTTYRATAAKVLAALRGSLPARKALADPLRIPLAPVD